jgi:hypothetical protein
MRFRIRRRSDPCRSDGEADPGSGVKTSGEALELLKVHSGGALDGVYGFADGAFEPVEIKRDAGIGLSLICPLDTIYQCGIDAAGAAFRHHDYHFHGAITVRSLNLDEAIARPKGKVHSW